MLEFSQKVHSRFWSFRSCLVGIRAVSPMLRMKSFLPRNSVIGTLARLRLHAYLAMTKGRENLGRKIRHRRNFLILGRGVNAQRRDECLRCPLRVPYSMASCACEEGRAELRIFRKITAARSSKIPASTAPDGTKRTPSSLSRFPARVNKISDATPRGGKDQILNTSAPEH